jgi:hypothetical protein
MIAYDKGWLNNLLVHQELQDASNKNYISKEEFASAEKKYSTGFYSPNIFIRIGLFISTLIIVSVSMGLISLIFLSAVNENGFGVLIFFFGLLCYGALEFIIAQKHHYKSGVDDALMLASGGCIIGGLNLVANISPTANAIVIFIIALYLLLRFANALMAVIAILALLALIFLVYIKLGFFAKEAVSFLLMIVAAAIYFFIKKISQQIQYRHYKNALIFIEITTLVCVYASVNYFVAREASISMFNLYLKEGDSIPFGWLFWFFSFFIPGLYIYVGLKKKDVVLLRVGLLLVAAIVFTVRYYHSALPIEIAMAAGGLVLIAMAYAVIQYLKEPKLDFTYAAIGDKHLPYKMNIEAIVIAETFTTVQADDTNTSFGGGSFGGGGANGDF